MLTRHWNIFIILSKSILMIDEFHMKKHIIKISINQFLKTRMRLADKNCTFPRFLINIYPIIDFAYLFICIL
jgi:hypothetical protein